MTQHPTVSNPPPSKKKARRLWRISPRHIRIAIGVMAGLAIFGVLAFSAWLSDLNSEVTTAFNGKKWAIPAKVYAQAIELYEGQSLSPSVLEFQLRSQGYQSVPRVIDPGTFSRR